MNIIWKEILQDTPEQIIYIPQHAKILYAREQNEKICIWYMRKEGTLQISPRKIYIHYTGVPFISTDFSDVAHLRYLGSAHLDSGAYIVHVFEALI